MPEQRLSIALNQRYNLKTAREVSEILGLSEKHVFKLARQGNLPSLKLGHYRRFTDAHIESFVDYLLLRSDAKDLANLKRELRENE